MSFYFGDLLDLVVAQHLVEKCPYLKGDYYGQSFGRHTGPFVLQPEIQKEHFTH